MRQQEEALAPPRRRWLRLSDDASAADEAPCDRPPSLRIRREMMTAADEKINNGIGTRAFYPITSVHEWVQIYLKNGWVQSPIVPILHVHVLRIIPVHCSALRQG